MRKEIQNKNTILSIYYQSLLEILGEKKADSIFQTLGLTLKEKNGSVHRGKFSQQIENIASLLARDYGELACQGLMIRMGRASLINFRRYFTSIADLGSIKNRLKPIKMRFLDSLRHFSDLLINEFQLKTSVIQKEKQFQFKMDLSDFREFDDYFSPFYFMGLLEEFCSWMDSRLIYRLSCVVDSSNRKTDIMIELQPPD